MSTTPLAVVTGASTGIGREMARELATRGWDVVLCSDEAAVEHAAADMMSGIGTGTATAVQADLATTVAREAVEGMLEGKGAVVTGSFAHKVQAVLSNLLPDTAAARVHASYTKARGGSADEPPGTRD